MSLRTAALYLIAIILTLAPCNAVFATGFAADQMCNPYIPKCGCGMVPKIENGKETCVKGANTYQCDVGICFDDTNDHVTKGKCVAENKCLGVLCDGKACTGQPAGFSGGDGSTPTQQPVTTPTIQNTAPPGTGLDQNSSILDTAKSGAYTGIPEPTQGPVNWPSAPTGENPAATGIDQIANQTGASGPENSQYPTTIDEAAKQEAGYGQTTLGTPSSLNPGSGPQQLENVPITNPSNFNSNTTGFNSPGGQQGNNFWNDVGQTFQNLGNEINNAVNGLTDYYNSPEFANCDFVCQAQQAMGFEGTDKNGVPFSKSDEPNFLSVERAPLMAALDPNSPSYDPDLRDRVAALTSEEVGSQGPDAQKAFVERLVNESVKNGYTSLNQAIDNGFYGPANRGEVDAYVDRGISAGDYANADKAISSVADGSNICNYCTNQGPDSSGGDQVIGGEHFGDLAGDPTWRNQQIQLAADFNSSNSNSFSNPMTIAELNASQFPGGQYGGTNLGNYPSLSPSSGGLSSQPTELTAGIENTPPPDLAAAEQYLKNLPLPEPIETSPQESVWNDVLKNAQDSAAENLNSFYDKVSSIFTPPPNVPLGSSLPSEFSYGGPTNDNIFNTGNNAQPFEWSSNGNIVSAPNDTTGSALDAQNEGFLSYQQQQADAEQKLSDEIQTRLDILGPNEPSIAGTLGEQENGLSNFLASNQGGTSPFTGSEPPPGTTDAEKQLADMQSGRTVPSVEEIFSQTFPEAESRIPVPEQVQVTPEQIAQEVADSNAKGQQETPTNAQEANDTRPNQSADQANVPTTRGILQAAQEASQLSPQQRLEEAFGLTSPPDNALATARDNLNNFLSQNPQFSPLGNSQGPSTGGALDQQENDFLASQQQPAETSKGIGSDIGTSPNQSEIVDNGPGAEPIENPPLPLERPNSAGATGINLQSCGGVCEVGNTGPDVKAIQQFLNTQSGSNLKVDGVYGSQTEVAVEKFQEDNNITADGIAGPQTIAKMNQIDAQQMAQTVAQTPVPATPDTQQQISQAFPEVQSQAGNYPGDIVSSKDLGSQDTGINSAGNTIDQSAQQQPDQQNEIVSAKDLGSQDKGISDVSSAIQNGQNTETASNNDTQGQQTPANDQADNTNKETPCASESCVGGELGDSRARPLTDQQQALQDRIDQENKDLAQLKTQYNNEVKAEDRVESAQGKVDSVHKGLSALSSSITAGGATDQQKATMSKGLSSASSLASDLRALGNPALAGKVDSYVASMKALAAAPPSLSLLGQAYSAVNNGQSLVSQATSYLSAKNDSLDSDAIGAQIKTMQSQITASTNQFDQLAVQQAQILAPTVPSNWPSGLYTPSVALPAGIPPLSSPLAHK